MLREAATGRSLDVACHVTLLGYSTTAWSGPGAHRLGLPRFDIQPNGPCGRTHRWPEHHRALGCNRDCSSR